MGPYVVHDISTSGAIKLATLYREHMLNWMSGCCMRKYHKPLMPKMIEIIHKVRECQERVDKINQEA